MAHASAPPAVFFHLVALADWQAAVDQGQTHYFAPFYTQDGFTHLTADAAFLLGVANTFYASDPRAYGVLLLAAPALDAVVKWEPPAPVGATASTSPSTMLFPHLYGGIPVASLLRVLPVTRDAAGAFLAIDGL
jgi:uncharacterized protein (DUF952 family)